MFNIEVFENVLREQVQRKKLAPKTMDGYMRCINQLEIKCSKKDGPSAVILEDAINQVCQGNKQVIKYIATIKKYERDVLHSPQLLLYGEPLIRLRKHQPDALKGKKLSNSETTYSHKINAIKDMKLKLGWRLQKQSGLRISEISDLTKSDIFFDEMDKSINLKVQHGKGRKARDVHVMSDEYVFSNLKAFIEPLGNKDKLFYSANLMIKMAAKYNMKTHDLRRINARQRFRQEIDHGSGRRSARSAVSKELGHSQPKITNVYLGDEWYGGGEEDEQEQT